MDFLSSRIPLRNSAMCLAVLCGSELFERQRVGMARKIARKCIATPHKLTISWLINLAIVLPAVSFAINTQVAKQRQRGTRPDNGDRFGVD